MYLDISCTLSVKANDAIQLPKPKLVVQGPNVKRSGWKLNSLSTRSPSNNVIRLQATIGNYVLHY